MKNVLQRILSVCLIFVLMVGALPDMIVASDKSASLVDVDTEADGKYSEETLELPEIVKDVAVKDRNHIYRRHEDEGENLNTLVYQNRDGSCTMYVYDFPVKYRDKDGKICDISLDIVESKEGFQTEANRIVTTFSEKLSDGIILSGEEVSLQLIPHVPDGRTSGRSGKLLNDQTVTYDFDTNTTLEYSLTYTGFKEDIVVSQYTGQTEYTFTLYTNGLRLIEIDGSYYLADEDGEIRATVGDIIVFTADERNNTFGQLYAETIIECEEYRMTIVLDEEYLADEDTVYPIRIDPTIELTYDNYGTGGIADVTINSNAGSSGSSGSLFVGLRSNYGISRALMSFPGLDISALDNAIINSATVQLRDIICEGTSMTVYCYPYTGTAWSEDSEWSDLSQSWGSLLSSQVISYSNGKQLSPAHRYSFDITSVVQAWVNGTSNKSKGIIFKADSSVETGTSANARTFASYNRSSNKPSLTLEYSLMGAITAPRNYVSEGSTLLLTADMDGSVTWTSSNSYCATVNSNGVVTGVHAGKVTITATCDGYANATFTVWVTVPDGIYYIKNAASGYCIENKTSRAYLYTKNIEATSKIYQLWKIAYVSNGYYVIRPLRDLSTVLAADSGAYVATLDASTTDSSIGTAQKFQIACNSFGYYFQRAGSSSYTMQPINAYANNSMLYFGAWSSSLSCHWELERIYGVFLRDSSTKEILLPSTTKYIKVGETYELSDLGISREYYGSATNGTWTSSGTSIVSTYANTGDLTARSTGQATITNTMTLNGVTYSASYIVKSSEILMSGYELDYEPELWNDNMQGEDFVEYPNCYSYALNVQINPETSKVWRMQPGQAVGYTLQSSQICAETVIAYVQADAEILGFVFEAIDKDEVCDEGCYKVVLAIDNGVDYHWYRQNSDGTWSHSLAGLEVSNVDAAGEVIYNPEDADHAYPRSGANYTDYLGFFQISPLSYMADANTLSMLESNDIRELTSESNLDEHHIEKFYRSID